MADNELQDDVTGMNVGDIPQDPQVDPGTPDPGKPKPKSQPLSSDEAKRILDAYIQQHQPASTDNGYQDDPLGNEERAIRQRHSAIRGVVGNVDATRVLHPSHVNDLSSEVTNLNNRQRQVNYVSNMPIPTQAAKDFLNNHLREKNPNANVDQMSIEQIQQQLPADHKTAQVVLNNFKNSRIVNNAVSSAKSYNQAALMWKKATDPVAAKQLDTQTGGTDNPSLVAPAQMASIIHDFSQQLPTQEWAHQNAQNNALYTQATKNLLTAYPEYGAAQAANIIAQAREHKGMNSAIFNVPDKKANDKLAEDLFNQGKLSAEQYDAYKKLVSPKIDWFHDGGIKTPGFIENFGEGAGNTLGEFGHSAKDLFTDYTPLAFFRNRAQEERDQMEEENTKTGVTPEHGSTEFGSVAGSFTGQALPMMLLTRGLGAAGLTEKAANSLVFALSTEHGARQEAISMFPDSPLKQYAYTTIKTLGNAALGTIYDKGKPLEGVQKFLNPEYEKVLNEFSAGKITGEAAKQRLKTGFADALKTSGEYLAGTGKHIASATGQLSAISAFNDGLDAVFGGKNIDAKSFFDHQAETIKTGILGNAVLAPMAAHADITNESKLVRGALWNMTERPGYYRDLIENTGDPAHQAAAPERLRNLELAVQKRKEMDDKPYVANLKPSEKQKYLMQSVSQEILKNQLEHTTDNVIRNNIKDQIKQSEAFNQRLIDKQPLDVKDAKEGEIAPHEDPKNIPALVQKLATGRPITDEDLALRKKFPEEVQAGLDKANAKDHGVKLDNLESVQPLEENVPKPAKEEPAPVAAEAAPVPEPAPQPMSVGDRLRSWADAIEGDKTALKSDVLALPKAVASTLLKGAAAIADAGGTLAQQVQHIVDGIRDHYQQSGQAMPTNDEMDAQAHRMLGEDDPHIDYALGEIQHGQKLDADIAHDLMNNHGMSSERAVNIVDEARRRNTKEMIAYHENLSKPSLADQIKKLRLVEGAQSIYKHVVAAMHPASFDGKKEARQSIIAIRSNLGEQQQQNEVMDAKSGHLKDFWNKQKSIENKQFMLGMENAGKYGSVVPAMRELAKAYKARLDAAYNMIASVKGVNYIDDYFPHLWKDPTSKKVSDVAASIQAKSPMEGNKSFLKRRIYDDIAEGLQAGLRLASDNPEEIVRLAEMNALKFKTAHEIMHDIKSMGIVQYVRGGEKAPEGWVTVEDPMFKKLFAYNDPIGDAQLGMGAYYMPEAAGRVVSNWLSKGLGSKNMGVKSLVGGMRAVNNALNLYQLGMSIFHFTTTSIDSTVTGFANGLSNTLAGKPKGILQMLGALSQVNNVQNIVRANKAIREYRSNNITSDVQDLMDANARTGMGKMYTVDAWYNFKKAMYKIGNGELGQIPKLVGNTLLLVPEAVGHPLMQWYVPRLKVGGYLRTVENELQMRPHLSPEDVTKLKQRVWDAMDNRLGQMVYDNLFWHKTTKDIAFLGLRSFGWTGGTVRGFGEAARDIPESGKRIVQGQGIANTTAWALSLPVVAGLYGAMYQYLNTGKKPDKLEDYFYPMDGTTNPDGTPHRVELPTYLKDVVAYKGHPLQTIVHKMSPGFSDLVSIYQNKDFFGEKIYEENDPFLQKTKDALSYELGQFKPFSFRDRPGEEKPILDRFKTKQGVEQFVGLMPAPKDLERTPIQEAIELASAKEFSKQDGKTHAEKEREIARRQIAKQIHDEFQQFRLNNPHSYDTTDTWHRIPQELKEKAGLSANKLKQFIGDSKLDYFEKKFKNLPSDQQFQLWKKMTPQEKEQFKKHLNGVKSFKDLPTTHHELFQGDDDHKTLEDIKKSAPAGHHGGGWSGNFGGSFGKSF